MKYLLSIVFLILGLSVQAADKSGGASNFDFRKKAEQKSAARWTLQDWLAQKDKNRMMDLWLSMNSASPYEYFLSGQYNSFQLDTTPVSSYKSYSGKLGLFASIIGLVGEYENNTEQAQIITTGSINLRIAGAAYQGTHLILGYGLRTNQMAQDKLAQGFGLVDLNLYLNKLFGISGEYRAFSEAQDLSQNKISSTFYSYGFFIDFQAVRVYGKVDSETVKTVNNIGTSTTTVKKSNNGAGFVFFF